MKARLRTSMVPLSLALLMSASGIAMAQQEERAQQESTQQKAKQTQQTQDVNRQAMEWLRDIQANTVQVSDTASRLRMMARYPMTYDRDAHEFELDRLKNSINNIGELVPQLQSRTDAPTWQKEIIDEVSSLLAAMDGQTEKAIKFVTDAPTNVRLHSNIYESRLVSIDHYAEHINELVDYADTRTERRRQEEQTRSRTSATSSR